MVKEMAWYWYWGFEPAGARSELGWVWFVIGRLPLPDCGFY